LCFEEVDVVGLALLTGLGSGAVHAVSGPDHVLSLAPLSVGRTRGAWRVGLTWGLGHAAGTLVSALVLIFAAAAIDLHGVEAWAERIAGLALVGLGLWGLVRRRARGAETAAAGTRGVAAVGLVHGLTGAAALLLLLPAIVSDSRAYQIAFLAAFSIGSTLAMAALTASLARLSRNGRCARVVQGRLPAVASACSVLLGSVWLVA